MTFNLSFVVYSTDAFSGKGHVLISIYIPSLICFERIDFSSNLTLKAKPEMPDTNWEVHLEQNLSMIVCLSRIW
jgi:hypothetical protein